MKFLFGKKEDNKKEQNGQMPECFPAAEQGDPEAQYQLGLLYLEGTGVKKNEKTAAEWFQKASDQGHNEAMRKLSWCYLYGRGTKRSLSEALRLSQIADGTEEKVDTNKFGALVRK